MNLMYFNYMTAIMTVLVHIMFIVFSVDTIRIIYHRYKFLMQNFFISLATGFLVFIIVVLNILFIFYYYDSYYIHFK